LLKRSQEKEVKKKKSRKRSQKKEVKKKKPKKRKIQ
jgi:hypothetical protein